MSDSAAGASPVECVVRPQRLYIVRIVREVYVLAIDEGAAKQAQREIERWEGWPTITAEPWNGRELDGWHDESGVYGTSQLLSLRAAKTMDSAA